MGQRTRSFRHYLLVKSNTDTWIVTNEAFSRQEVVRDKVEWKSKHPDHECTVLSVPFFLQIGQEVET